MNACKLVTKCKYRLERWKEINSGTGESSQESDNRRYPEECLTPYEGEILLCAIYKCKSTTIVGVQSISYYHPTSSLDADSFRITDFQT